MAYGSTATDRLRRANVDIRHGNPILGDPQSLRLYFCECGAEDCAMYVELAPGEFDSVVQDGTHVLAPGHVLERAKAARLHASGLRQDAQALHAQARQAVRHAAELRGESGEVSLASRAVTVGLSPRCRLGWRWRSTQPGIVIRLLWLRIYVG